MRFAHVNEPLLPLTPNFIEAVVCLDTVGDLDYAPRRGRNARANREL